MDSKTNPPKFVLPSPCFEKPQKPAKPTTSSSLPHFLSPQGMMLPREHQPPPMYGPRGATVPPRYMGQYKPQEKFHGGGKSFSKGFGRDNYCETCELEFRSDGEYERHNREHVFCDVDGCSFAAQAVIVKTHFEMQHSSGLYDQIKKLASPEEISKWRAERKKRYPTKTNIELRQKAQEERMKRGERLEKSKNRFGRQEDRRPMQRNERNPRENSKPQENSKEADNKSRKRGRRAKKKNNETQKARKVMEKKEVTVETTETIPVEEGERNGNILMFKGTSSLTGYKKIKEKVVEKNVLTSLLGMYGSSDDDNSDCTTEEEEESEEEGETDSEPEIKKTKEDDDCDSLEESAMETTTESKIDNEIDTLVDVVEHTAIADTTDEKIVQETVDQVPKGPDDMDDDDEGPEEVAIAKSSDLPDKVATPKLPPIQKEKQRKPKVVRKSGLNYKLLRKSEQNTMLEKLLEKDIRHERNVLLQCVRYVVENDFFGIGANSEK